MEWSEEFEEAEPGHRHISHLYGLHPGNQIHNSIIRNFLRLPEKQLNTVLLMEEDIPAGAGHGSSTFLHV